MRPNLIANHVDAPRARDAALSGERVRVIGAFAALLASALFLAGGLLWRENARAERRAGATALVR